MRLRHGGLALSLWLLTGCQAWRIERPLPARAELLDIQTTASSWMDRAKEGDE